MIYTLDQCIIILVLSCHAGIWGLRDIGPYRSVLYIWAVTIFQKTRYSDIYKTTMEWHSIQVVRRELFRIIMKLLFTSLTLLLGTGSIPSFALLCFALLCFALLWLSKSIVIYFLSCVGIFQHKAGQPATGFTLRPPSMLPYIPGYLHTYIPIYVPGF